MDLGRAQPFHSVPTTPNPYTSKSSGVGRRSAPPEVLVRPFRGEGELRGVGVQVALGRLDRGVSEDVIDDVKWDAGIREPCGSGVSEVVSPQTGVTESLHQIGPVRCSRERPGGEDAAPGASEQRLIMFAVLGYAPEHGLQRLKDRHPPCVPALGGLEA